MPAEHRGTCQNLENGVAPEWLSSPHAAVGHVRITRHLERRSQICSARGFHSQPAQSASSEVVGAAMPEASARGRALPASERKLHALACEGVARRREVASPTFLVKGRREVVDL